MLNWIKGKYHSTKHSLKVGIDFYKWRIKNWFSYIRNPLIRNQIKNPKSIPIIIISFNQLFYLKQLIEFLLKKNFSNIVILDNNSTYQPLLDYFKEIETNSSITIHQLNENKGHLVFWENEEIFKKYSKGFYVVTDADIVPKSDVPKNFMSVFLKLLINNKDITKVGFSLLLDDLPDFNPNKQNILKWESQFWQTKVGNHFFTSIDTTFALYRPNYKRIEQDFLSAIRTSPPFIARHGGWYINPSHLTDEQKFYLKTANNSSSWLTDENGNLKNDTFKAHYNNDDN